MKVREHRRQQWVNDVDFTPNSRLLHPFSHEMTSSATVRGRVCHMENGRMTHGASMATQTHTVQRADVRNNEHTWWGCCGWDPSLNGHTNIHLSKINYINLIISSGLTVPDSGVKLCTDQTECFLYNDAFTDHCKRLNLWRQWRETMQGEKTQKKILTAVCM